MATAKKTVSSATDTLKMNGKNRKWWILGAIGALLILWGIMSYNRMVNLQEAVNTKWSAVESDYQRRSDLVPNLVSTVKGAANFEQETLTKVVEARAKATAITVNAENADDIAKFQAAQGELSSALSRLLFVAEQYPQLQAVQAFRDLQVQLEGTENRIAVARKDFSSAAKDYNVVIKRFPNMVVAGVFGFDPRAYFEAESGAETAPTVDFGQ